MQRIKKFETFIREKENPVDPHIEGEPMVNPHDGNGFDISKGARNAATGAGVANYETPHPDQPSPPPFTHTNSKLIYRRAFDQYLRKNKNMKNKKISRNDLPAYDQEKDVMPNKYGTSEPHNQLNYYKINNPH